MFLRPLVVLIVVLMAANVHAVPMDTTSAVGGFLSWRDCTTVEQSFCDGGLGGTNIATNGGTGDRSVVGGIGVSSLTDSFAGATNVGNATFSADMMNTNLGMTISLSSFAGPDGRTAATVGGYQGLKYTGTSAATKNLNVTMDYSKGADGDQIVPGSSTAYSTVALVRSSSNTVTVDADFHFLGENSVGRDTASDLVFANSPDLPVPLASYTVGLNTFTIADVIELNDPAAGSGSLNAVISIDLAPGDVFFLVAFGQTVGNRSGLNSINLTTGFTDTYGLEAASVPGPLSILVLLVGFAGFGIRRIA